jgi:hypothetical protein
MLPRQEKNSKRPLQEDDMQTGILKIFSLIGATAQNLPARLQAMIYPAEYATPFRPTHFLEYKHPKN